MIPFCFKQPQQFYESWYCDWRVYGYKLQQQAFISAVVSLLLTPVTEEEENQLSGTETIVEHSSGMKAVVRRAALLSVG